MAFLNDHKKQYLRAEAAAWLARLQADDCSEEDRRLFQLWLQKAPENVAAFESMTSIWQESGGAMALSGPAPTPHKPLAFQRRALIGSVLAAGLIAVGVETRSNASHTLQTDIGETRRVYLADGSTITLDTDTQIKTKIDETQRLIELNFGRIILDVRPNNISPMHVHIGNSLIRSFDTSMEAEHLEKAVSVTLAKGTADILASKASTALPLSAGDRIRIDPDGEALRDHVALPAQAEWPLGYLNFDNVMLSEAVARINRYSRTPIRIYSDDLAQERISGYYKANDILSFAQSAGLLLSARITITPSEIRLSANKA